MLRDYQQRAINELYEWFKHNDGNPCLVLPTGSGKSHIVAALCKDAVKNWPDTSVLMLTHVKELIEQNAEKMREHWPNAPMGIYSASLKKRELGEPITFAGIQSVRKKSKEIGHIDLCIIDECHLVSHKEVGGYRTLIKELLEINPNMRVIGLSATPYRLGHGMITDKPALFDGLIEPVSIDELIYKGFLAPLHSKVTNLKLSTDNVRQRGGEFIESELQAAVDTQLNNEAVVDEVIKLAGDRKAWLFFCTGVKHAQNIKEMLLERNIEAECITGQTPKSEREEILKAYKSGQIRALTNCDVLTTGFDYPDIDLIAMLRPTMSPSLYVQMAGRGLRPKSHTNHCLVLDFAGVVKTHGPITNVRPSDKVGKGGGGAPTKICEQCFEIVHISEQFCPSCGAPFPAKKPPTFVLSDLDIMGLPSKRLKVGSWSWQVAHSKKNGLPMIKVTYYGSSLSDSPVREYLCVLHDGWAGQKALQLLTHLAHNCGVTFPVNVSIDSICEVMNNATFPAEIKYRIDGKYHQIENRIFNGK
jgi:DNA repair protein RadD